MGASYAIEAYMEPPETSPTVSGGSCVSQSEFDDGNGLWILQWNCDTPIGNALSLRRALLICGCSSKAQDAEQLFHSNDDDNSEL
jgi:hypothetical protein